MKTKHLLFIVLLAFMQVSPVNLQSQDWVARYTGTFQNSIDLSYWVTIDEDGNSYVTGRSDYKYATIKYNSSGVQQWEARTNSGESWANCIDINTDNYGKVYVTGYTTYNSYKQITTYAYSTSDGGANWSTSYNSAYGDCIGWMVKYDPLSNDIYVVGERTGNGTGLDYVVLRFDGSTGDLSDSWPDNGFGDGVRVYNGTGNGDDKALSIAISAGDVYVTGVSYNDRGGYDNTTVAYEGDGDLKWVARSAGGDITINERKNLIAADYSRGVYVTNSSGGYVVVLKYDPGDGSLQWAHGGSYSGVGRSIGFFSRTIGNTWAHTNDVFVTGLFNGHLGVIKYFDNGDLDWEREYDGNGQGYFLGIDDAENVYACGYLQSTYLNMVLVSYSSGGDLNGAYTYNGPGNADDKAVSLAVDPSGVSYITGLSYGSSTNLDYATIKNQPLNDGGDHFMIQNLNGTENPESLIPDSYSLQQNYPNPFNPVTTINYALPHNGIIYLKVYDVLGREIKELASGYKEAGYYNVSFDGSNLPSGIYIYKLVTNDFTDIKKMILVK